MCEETQTVINSMDETSTIENDSRNTCISSLGILSPEPHPRPLLGMMMMDQDFSCKSSDSGVVAQQSPCGSSRASESSDFTCCLMPGDGDVSLSQMDDEDAQSISTDHQELFCSVMTPIAAAKVAAFTDNNFLFTVTNCSSATDGIGVVGNGMSPLYMENEYQQVSYPKRSSSLKSTCTPPGTPGQCKMVRFADAFGLDLVTVKHIVNQDCPPHIPASARRDLHLSSGSDSESETEVQTYTSLKQVNGSNSQSFRVKRTYRPCFPQPGNNPNFLRRVWDQSICLDTVTFDDLKHQLKGYVCVRNLTYHKSVLLRYTFSNWQSYTDIPATYLEPFHHINSPTTNTSSATSGQHSEVDRFQFSLYLPDTISDDEKLQFALLYRTDQPGEEYWDNNFGQNYAFMMFELLQEVK